MNKPFTKETEVGIYKGYPILMLNPKEKVRQMWIGVSKADLIVNNLSTIKQYLQDIIDKKRNDNLVFYDLPSGAWEITVASAILILEKYDAIYDFSEKIEEVKSLLGLESISQEETGSYDERIANALKNVRNK